MNVDINQQEGFLVIKLEGRLDTAQSSSIEKKFLEILDQGHNKIILDCKYLDYISSSGLRIFLIAQKRMLGVSGTLVICCLQPHIREVFDISGFSMIFSISPDLETALNTDK
jgi:stage II sporulation protein AA (anti-sigma F factor antagonist)